MSINVGSHNRKGDWMETYTGGQYWPCDPRVDEVHPKDVAHALANICRYGGHARRFYSVAEHSIHVSRYAESLLYSRDCCLHALLHDAAKAFTGDIPRPLKHTLQRSSPEFAEMLEANEKVVAQRFNVPHELPAWLKEIDDRILGDEREQLMDSRQLHNWWTHPKGPLNIEVYCWEPSMAEQRFLKRMRNLGVNV